MIKSNSKSGHNTFEIDPSARTWKDLDEAKAVLTSMRDEGVVDEISGQVLMDFTARLLHTGKLPEDHRDPDNYGLEGPDQDGTYTIHSPLLVEPVPVNVLPEALHELARMSAEFQVTEAGFQRILEQIYTSDMPYFENVDLLINRIRAGVRSRDEARYQAELERMEAFFEERRQRMQANLDRKREIENLNPFDLAVRRLTEEGICSCGSNHEHKHESAHGGELRIYVLNQTLKMPSGKPN